jgi:hypothetical protein
MNPIAQVEGMGLGSERTVALVHAVQALLETNASLSFALRKMTAATTVMSQAIAPTAHALVILVGLENNVRQSHAPM